jgi:hypothetical protein
MLGNFLTPVRRFEPIHPAWRYPSDDIGQISTRRSVTAIIGFAITELPASLAQSTILPLTSVVIQSIIRIGAIYSFYLLYFDPRFGLAVGLRIDAEPEVESRCPVRRQVQRVVNSSLSLWYPI